jgi:hypothetical protein
MPGRVELFDDPVISLWIRRIVNLDKCEVRKKIFSATIHFLEDEKKRTTREDFSPLV